MGELDRETILSVNRAGWDKVAGRFWGGNALPVYGPLAETEETLGLLDDISGKRVLEIGCGSGHSLSYMARQKASELWGLDLSPTQIDLAQALLTEQGFAARLFVSPMEQNPGLPLNYFDLVVSIYALGWTTDLARTLSLIQSYLKSGGVFIFSWEHPAYSCLEYEDDHYIVKHAYHDEMPVFHSDWNGVEIVIHQRRLSTFINTAVMAGLQIERLVEPDFNLMLAHESQYAPERWYTVPRAKLLPTTFILKLRKPTSQ
jgi:SAM-dependent methyltransferase